MNGLILPEYFQPLFTPRVETIAAGVGLPPETAPVVSAVAAVLPPVVPAATTTAARIIKSYYRESFPEVPVGGIESQLRPENIPYADTATQADYEAATFKWQAGLLANIFPVVAGYNILKDLLAGDMPGTAATQAMPLPGSIAGEVATVGTAAPLLPTVIPGGGGTITGGGLFEQAGLGGEGMGLADKALIGVGIIAAAVIAASFFGRKK